MSDIVERLREVNCEWEYDAATCAEAADEITKLRAALKGCIAMLEQLGYTPISKVARAALEDRT